MTESERLALLAHELRSPVAALQAIEQTVRTVGNGLDPAERARLLGVAVDACRDLERLLSDPDVLSISVEPVDLAVLLEGMRAERVTVSAEAGLAVVGDPVRLRQAVGNLVANGLRHGTLVSVEAAGGGDDGEVHVTVSDDGPGVDPSLDPFARGASGAGSTGLGLYVAREIAEAHGGTLELVPTPGRGASFRLALPRASAATA